MVTARQAKTRHAALVAELRTHDYRYYVLDDPTLTDREYQSMRDAAIRVIRLHLRLNAGPRLGGEGYLSVSAGGVVAAL